MDHLPRGRAKRRTSAAPGPQSRSDGPNKAQGRAERHGREATPWVASTLQTNSSHNVATLMTRAWVLNRTE